MSIPVISYLLKWNLSTISLNNISPFIQNTYLKIKRIKLFFVCLKSKATLQIVRPATDTCRSEPAVDPLNLKWENGRMLS